MGGYWNWAAGAYLAVMSFIAFRHLSRLKFSAEPDDPTQRWSAKMLQITGLWQIGVAWILLSTPNAPQDSWSTTSFPLFLMGLALLLWGQAKWPSKPMFWVARRWRPARALLWFAGAPGYRAEDEREPHTR